MTYTVLVCGDPDYADYARLEATLSSLCDQKGLWKGGYSPAKTNVALLKLVFAEPKDGFAPLASLVSTWGTCYYPTLAAYALDPKLGVCASAVRNKEMFELNKIDLVLCFGSDKAVSDIISHAYKAKIQVRHIK